MDNFNASLLASSGCAFSELFIEWFHKQSVLLLCSRHYSVVKLQTDRYLVQCKLPVYQECIVAVQ